MGFQLRVAEGRAGQDERRPSVMAGLAPVNHVVVVPSTNGVDAPGTCGRDIGSPGAGSRCGDHRVNGFFDSVRPNMRLQAASRMSCCGLLGRGAAAGRTTFVRAAAAGARVLRPAAVVLCFPAAMFHSGFQLSGARVFPVAGNFIIMPCRLSTNIRA